MDRAQALTAVMRAADVLLGVAQASSNPMDVRQRNIDVARIFLHLGDYGGTDAPWMLTYRPDLLDNVWVSGCDYDIELREAVAFLAEEAPDGV